MFFESKHMLVIVLLVFFFGFLVTSGHAVPIQSCTTNRRDVEFSGDDTSK